ncbi:dimethyl sulfoxide reductase anchor subunit [Sulfurimonas sp. SAG-AH-194-I05]|nr:DmsC/YnfH family molybdoenzyme membrane anchor subunit [Sulfurimonas sp. SAG-AH-194-I05]MDF1875621.1 dimethyl sulfoxide reductase anchor subunit [Sulfurimonas sp. SAG-AH-194-I05]
MQTPIESFLEHKTDTGMQCGNYSIEIADLKEGEQYRFHFDATACVGCHCCEVACNEQNNNPADIKWRRVGEMEGGVFPEFSQIFNSMSCNHCLDPECLIGCPTNSYIKIEETGIVIHEDDTCIGCQYCTWNCPYGVPTYHEERKIVTKCHMCNERLEEGQTPSCVQACPSGAIEIEVVNIKQWLEKDMKNQANMPFLPDASITNSTTRYTLPENMPTLSEVDAHILKASHPEIPLVFMTVLTQISLGGFFVLFLGDILSLAGFESANWVMALLVMLPAALGLPLSALHLGRPFLALTAMKNIKTSWLSREALALGLFTGLMSGVVAMYFFEVSHALRLGLEALTLACGIYGIHAQSMIYRIKARPSWNRRTTNIKFFGVAYIGALLMAFVAVVLGLLDVAIPLIVLAMLGALAQIFFSFEDLRALKTLDENTYQLRRSARLYDENFKKVKVFRFISIVIGGLLLPLFVITLVSAQAFGGASLGLLLSLTLVFASELSDRFLFYSTVVPLGMAGGFFVGKQRG